VRPTLLVSLFGIVPDIRRGISSDFKSPGDWIFLIGPRRNVFGAALGARPANQFGRYALGGSYLEKVCAGPAKPASRYGDGAQLGAAPSVDIAQAPAFYRQVAESLVLGDFASIHDISDGGLAVALAESAIGGRLGAQMRSSLPDGTSLDAEFLFNEEPSRFLVSVPP